MLVHGAAKVDDVTHLTFQIMLPWLFSFKIIHHHINFHVKLSDTMVIFTSFVTMEISDYDLYGNIQIIRFHSDFHYCHFIILSLHHFVLHLK